MVTTSAARKAALKPKRDKLDAIVDAATDLFTTNGYETTTIAEVAKKAGVAVGTVYLYFKNKQEILYAVRDCWNFDFVQYMLQQDFSGIPHHKRIRPLVDACFAACEEQAEKVQLMGLSPQVIGGKKWGLGDSTPDMVHLIKNWIDQAVAEGAFRRVDAEKISLLAYSMVNAALEQCYYAGNEQDKQAYIDTLVDAFTRWVVKPELWPQVADS